MNSKRYFLFSFLLLFLFSACNPTKCLKENEYMLMQNVVKVEDAKNPQFDNLIYLVRPEPNNKFMRIFNLETSAYASHQPKIKKKTGEIKDSKFNRWMRESVGEPPVLLDSAQIENSIEQIEISMRKLGYFHATTHAEVEFKRSDPQKTTVNYIVTAHQPYFIREVHYHIDVPEFRKIIILDSANCLFKAGEQYNENILADERTRLTSLMRNHGYYYFSNNFITMEVDTINALQYRDKNNNPTLAITVFGDFDAYKNEEAKLRTLYKYTYNKVYLYTNYDIQYENSTAVDTIRFRSFRDKTDSTTYYFITPKLDNRFNKKNKLIRDFKYRTITDVVYTKKGGLFTQSSYDRSYKRLTDLQNFNMINIDFVEDISLRDSLNREGKLDVVYKLTRRKLHSIGGELSVRSDRTNLSLTYSNRNIFKGAERLTVNLYGGFVYQNLIGGRKVDDGEGKRSIDIYGNLGGTVTLEFPRLFLLKQTQRRDALRYSTSIALGANYSWQYNRFMMNASLTYNWSPNHYFNHYVSPISISTIDTSAKTIRHIKDYPESYQGRFSKDMITSIRYGFAYLIPIKNSKHSLRLNFDLESSGLIPYGINAFGKAVSKNDKTWKIIGYNYTTYELAEITLRYTRTFNKNNSFASRFNLGMALSYDPDKQIPFERSFYLGGPNSMRAWGVRTLGPGNYYNDPSLSGLDFFEKTGDLKLEVNFEYRGTFYKAFKYGVFVDMGNVWFTRQYDDMPLADFRWNTFYKQIAIGVGVGLRLDFNFFLIRLDYSVPIHDPSMPQGNYWINKGWYKKDDNGNRLWYPINGLQFAIGHAF